MPRMKSLLDSHVLDLAMRKTELLKITRHRIPLHVDVSIQTTFSYQGQQSPEDRWAAQQINGEYWSSHGHAAWESLFEAGVTACDFGRLTVLDGTMY